MRALVLILITIFSLGVAAKGPTAPNKPAPSAVAPTKNVCDGNIEGGDPNPWPWGAEAKFPWDSIRGTWASLDECDRVFSFKRKTVSVPLSIDPSKKSYIVNITEYNESCNVIATGVGYEAHNVVRATMVKKGSGDIYDLTVRRFAAVTGATPALRSPALVLTVSPHGEWLKRKSFEVQKISDHTRLFCYDMP